MSSGLTFGTSTSANLVRCLKGKKNEKEKKFFVKSRHLLSLDGDPTLGSTHLRLNMRDTQKKKFRLVADPPSTKNLENRHYDF
jgi:hypothetical protein